MVEFGEPIVLGGTMDTEVVMIKVEVDDHWIVSNNLERERFDREEIESMEDVEEVTLNLEDVPCMDDDDENEFDETGANSNANEELDSFWKNHESCPIRCTNFFDQSRIRKMREDCRKVDHCRDGVNTLDALLRGMIHIMKTQEYVEKRRRNTDKEHERGRCHYMIEGVKVCRPFFLFAHKIGRRRWENQMKLYQTQGFVVKRDESYNVQSAQSMWSDRAKFVGQFLKNYCDDNGISSHSRLPNCDDVVTLLPSGVTKAALYKEYKAACDACEPLMKPVSLRSFYRLCRKIFPQITTHNPRTPLSDQN